MLQAVAPARDRSLLVSAAKVSFGTSMQGGTRDAWPTDRRRHGVSSFAVRVQSALTM